MTKRARKTVFYLLVAAFFIVGAAIILYSEGWRLDFGKWRFEKVGAILVRPYPLSASIELNGKPVKNQAGLFSEDTLISDLAPGNFSLTLDASGYDGWRENVTVMPSLVTELKNAVLVPAAPSYTGTSTIDDFFTSQSEGGALLTETSGGSINFRGTPVAHGMIVSVNPGASSFIYKNTLGTFEFYDISSDHMTNLSVPFASSGINLKNFLANGGALEIDPYSDGNIIAINSSKILFSNTGINGGAVIQAARAANGISFADPVAASQSFIAFSETNQASGTSAIAVYDKFAKTISVSSDTVMGRTTDLKWIDDGLLGVLQSDGSLYSYDVHSETYEKLSSDVKDFVPAPDGSAIAAFGDKGLEILPFSSDQTYERFNIPDASQAGNVIWYKDGSHLFVVYPEYVKFLDLDDLGLNNFIKVSDGTNPLYNPAQNIFYVKNQSGKVEEFAFPSS